MYYLPDYTALLFFYCMKSKNRKKTVKTLQNEFEAKFGKVEASFLLFAPNQPLNDQDHMQ